MQGMCHTVNTSPFIAPRVWNRVSERQYCCCSHGILIKPSLSVKDLKAVANLITVNLYSTLSSSKKQSGSKVSARAGTGTLDLARSQFIMKRILGLGLYIQHYCYCRFKASSGEFSEHANKVVLGGFLAVL
jgi:hypothetical protein